MNKGYEIKVLDHGYVRFVDSLGTDETIVEAARMSTGRGFVSWNPYSRCKRCDTVWVSESAEDMRPQCLQDGCVSTDFERFPRGDLGILDYLYRMGHTTPFEMCELIIDVQVPMDAWRQWIRNRTASVNEYSTRYSEAIDLMAATEPGAWRTQGATNRQGSGEFLGTVDVTDEHGITYRGGYGAHLSNQEVLLQDHAREVYEERLRLGVAKEQARKDLPLSTYTAARWKIDLHNLLHNFLAKRMHPHAQIEIRSYANAVAEIVKAVWPNTYSLYEEYTLGGVHLSRTEARLLSQYARADVREMPVDVNLAPHLQEVARRMTMKLQICDGLHCTNAFQTINDYTSKEPGWTRTTRYVERPRPARPTTVRVPDPIEVHGEVTVKGESCPFVIRRPPEVERATEDFDRAMEESERMLDALPPVVDEVEAVLCPSCSPKMPPLKARE